MYILRYNKKVNLLVFLQQRRFRDDVPVRIVLALARARKHVLFVPGLNVDAGTVLR